MVVGLFFSADHHAMSGMYAPQKSTHFEFMGPHGSFVSVLAVFSVSV